MQEADLKSAEPTQSLEAEIESGMQADLETPGPSHVQEPHQTSLLNSGDLKLEVRTVVISQSNLLVALCVCVWEERVLELIEFQHNCTSCRHQDTDVTFTTMPTAPQAATSQNSLVRLQRSSPDLSTFVQDMTDKYVALWISYSPLDCLIVLYIF